MPCFGSSDESRISLIPSICIHCPFPPDPERYLPKLTEHKIQSEPHDIIDDPSSIFFDPNEKAGFVYSHVPSVIIDYDKQLILTLPESKHEQIKNATEKENKERERQISISSEFADSLDRTPSLSGSPLRGENDYNNRFNEHFRQVSRQDSLEFDPIVDGPICQVTLSNKDYCRPPANRADGLSEDDVRKLYETSHEPFFIDDFNDLHIYEEDILNDIAKNNGNKGYLSDAESVKTYQDSGIYDDDVIMESPNRLQQSTKEEIFRDVEMQMEKYSAFKTPLSSRHNSLEYLALESPIKIINQMSRKTDEERDGDEGDDNAASENDSLDMEIIENILELESSEKRSKKTDKYSHIQAKVQCFRTKAERSPSPGSALRKRTPECPTKASLKRTQSRLGVKPKVDSLSNVKYVPGGGSTKVFKEKLKFRENAQPRTDTHGIEMYAHLPTEFQEIARRLARQDNQLKEQKQQRGRCLTRSKSSAGRSSSKSPKRGRSRTKKTKTSTAGESISNISNDVKQKKLALESLPIVKPPCLSRSSSIRSVPSAPKISQRHPSSSKINRTPSMTAQSPSTSMPHSDKTKSKQKDSTRTKENTSKSKDNSGKLRDITPKSKDNTAKTKDPSLKVRENSTKPKEKENNPKPKEAKATTTTTTTTTKEVSPTNVSSLCQYISDNETFGSKQRGEDASSNTVPPLYQPSPETDNVTFANSTRLQAVPAH